MEKILWTGLGSCRRSLRISTVQAEWKHNSISMRWCCKICRFSSPNQRTLITRYKLKHCHQLFRSKCYEDIPEMTSILESLDKDSVSGSDGGSAPGDDVYGPDRQR